jgi:hypothetical protein
MKKKINLAILLCFVTTMLFSQIKRDTILYERISGSKPMPRYLINDSVYYKWYHNKYYFEKDDEYALYKDSVLLSIGPCFSVYTYFYDKHKNRLYMQYGRDNYIFDLTKDTLLTSTVSYDEPINNFYLSNNKLYYSKCASLYIQNLDNEKLIDSVNISTIADKEFYCISRIINFPNTNEVLIETGYVYYGDEITNIQYHIYNEADKTLTFAKNNDVIKENIEHQWMEFCDITEKSVFFQECIINSTGDIFSKKLYLNYGGMNGFVITKGEIKQFILCSQLDSEDGKKDRNAVLIPFIPDSFKEKAMYEIYENIELTAEDLQRFDAFDLRLLRNMIFAKHNSVFKDKFLQAYFNLYGFYSYNKNRLTNVNHLLTPTDKKNLELIQLVSKQK